MCMLSGPAPALPPTLPPTLPCTLSPGSELAQCLTRSIQQSYHAAQVQVLAQARDLLMSADPRAEPVVVGQPLPLDADFLTRARDNKAQVRGAAEHGGLHTLYSHAGSAQCLDCVCCLGVSCLCLFAVAHESCQAASELNNPLVCDCC